VRAEQRGVLEAVARYYAEDDAESA
jgi:hypothetical protein